MFFNATDIDTTSQFDAIPAGDYEAMVTASELKATKDGTGNTWNLRSKSSPAPAKAGACGTGSTSRTATRRRSRLHRSAHATVPRHRHPATAERRDAAAQPARRDESRREERSRARPDQRNQGLQGQGRDQCAGFPGAARNSASRDGCTGHALGESGLRWLHWPFAPTSLATATLDAIDAAMLKAADDGLRQHLGASLIGKPCERALWYTFRWTTLKSMRRASCACSLAATARRTT